MTDKTTEALKLAEEALDELRYANDTDIAKTKYYKALAAIREALAKQEKQEPAAVISESAIGLVKLHSNGVSLPFGTQLYAAPVQPVKQKPAARPFECWSTNDGDSWFEHPADAQLIYDVLGDDPKVGDEFEVSAGWNCVTATYQIASKDGDDFEVKCVSHPNNDTAPVDAKAIRAEALEEAAKVCEKAMIQMNYSEAPYKQCAAAIRWLK